MVVKGILDGIAQPRRMDDHSAQRFPCVQHQYPYLAKKLTIKFNLFDSYKTRTQGKVDSMKLKVNKNLSR